MTRRPAQSGFSLLELSVVLVLVGLLLRGGVYVYDTQRYPSCLPKVEEQLATIQASLNQYAITNGRLPRPADPAHGSNNPQFGVEIASFASPGSVAVTGTVAIGSIPHTTLGLPVSYAADCWNNKFTYAVTAALTSADPATGYQPSAGTILLRGGTRAAPQDLMTDGAYVVISHGSNAIGGTPLSAGDIAARWCTLAGGNQIDRENCDNANATFFDAPSVSGNVEANFFDDVIVYAGKSAATAPAVGHPQKLLALRPFL